MSTRLPTLSEPRAQLPHITQSLGSSSCNVAQTRKALHYNRGIDITERRCRQIMGKLSGPTGTTHTRRVFRHFGLVEGVDYVLLNGAPWARARDLLDAGWYVTFYTRYRYVNNNWPRHSGDRRFNGVHAQGAVGRWRAGGRWRVSSHDSLHDGRRNSRAVGGRYPRGPIRARQRILRVAAEKYCQSWLGSERGKGRVAGYAVRKRARFA